MERRGGGGGAFRVVRVRPRRRELQAGEKRDWYFRGEIIFSLPNNQRQHRTLQIQKDVLPYALC